MSWIIVNKSDDALAWSNEEGWVEETFDTFNEEERETLLLPLDGEWRQVAWRA